MKKALIIYSGGLDSTVLLYSLIPEFELSAVNFHYGSKHNDREREAARTICHDRKLKLYEIALPFINQLYDSTLLQSGGELPVGEYDRQSMASTVVPFRNGILLSIAAGLAESIGAEAIYYGAHSGDHHIYPDCRPEFFSAFASAVKLGTEGRVELRAPFLDLSKGEIVAIGGQLGVPFEETYSCYQGREQHCGQCGTCIERKRAFEAAGLQDRIPYLT